MSEYQYQNWFRKFSNAFRGIWIVAISQQSFLVHLFVTAVVIGLAIFLPVSLLEWLLLATCITVVMTAELVNTSIEYLSRKVTKDESRLVKDSLDAAAGAVLIASMGSAVIGGCILIPKLLASLNII